MYVLRIWAESSPNFEVHPNIHWLAVYVCLVMSGLWMPFKSELNLATIFVSGKTCQQPLCTLYMSVTPGMNLKQKKPCPLFTEEVIALFTLQTIRSRSSDFLSREKKVKGI